MSEHERAAELFRQINALEDELQGLRGRMAEMEVRDYELVSAQGEPLRLSELFGEKTYMLLVHNMGFSCRYCTMWADGFNAVLPEIEKHAALVIASPDEPQRQSEGAKARGWRLPMVSVRATSLIEDLGFGSNDEPMPGVSLLAREADGGIRRLAMDWFGPRDRYCPVWNLLALLPEEDRPGELKAAA